MIHHPPLESLLSESNVHSTLEICVKVCEYLPNNIIVHKLPFVKRVMHALYIEINIICDLM